MRGSPCEASRSPVRRRRSCWVSFSASWWEAAGGRSRQRGIGQAADLHPATRGRVGGRALGGHGSRDWVHHGHFRGGTGFRRRGNLVGRQARVLAASLVASLCGVTLGMRSFARHPRWVARKACMVSRVLVEQTLFDEQHFLKGRQRPEIVGDDLFEPVRRFADLEHRREDVPAKVLRFGEHRVGTVMARCRLEPGKRRLELADTFRDLFE